MKLFLLLLKVTNANQIVLETVSFDLTGKKTIMWENFWCLQLIEFIAAELIMELFKILYQKLQLIKLTNSCFDFSLIYVLTNWMLNRNICYSLKLYFFYQERYILNENTTNINRDRNELVSSLKQTVVNKTDCFRKSKHHFTFETTDVQIKLSLCSLHATIKSCRIPMTW